MPLLLQDLPSLIIKLIAEALKRDEKDQSLGSLTLTSKAIRAICMPVLWEMCEWNEDYDWMRLFSSKTDVLKHIKVLELICLKWRNEYRSIPAVHRKSVPRSSWDFLSELRNLNFLGIQADPPAHLPPEWLTFPNLVELELREYNYVEESDELMEKRRKWEALDDLFPAYPATSFPRLERLFLEGGTGLIHSMCEQLGPPPSRNVLMAGGRVKGIYWPSGTYSAGSFGSGRPFQTVKLLTMWIAVENMHNGEDGERSEVFALPEETFKLLAPNVVELDIEQDSIWSDELDELHEGQKVTMMSCIPSLHGLKMLEQLRISADIVSHSEWDDNSEVRIQLREHIPASRKAGKIKPAKDRKVKINEDNVKQVLPRILDGLDEIRKVTLEWPFTFGDEMGDKVDKIKSVVMTRTEGSMAGETEVTWEEKLEVREECDHDHAEEGASLGAASTTATVGPFPKQAAVLQSLAQAHSWAEANGEIPPAEWYGPMHPVPIDLGPARRRINLLLRGRGL